MLVDVVVVEEVVPAGWTPTMKIVVEGSVEAALQDFPPSTDKMASNPEGTGGSRGLVQYVATLMFELLWEENTTQYFLLD